MYSIKQTSQLTGVSAATLRVWERRYGVVEPVRTDGGYRVYSDLDVSRVDAMRRLITGGWSTQYAADYVMSAPMAGSRTSPVDVVESFGSGRMSRVEVHGLIAARLLSRSLADALDDWLMPLLVEMGRAWALGVLDVDQEHILSQIVARCLWTAMDHHIPPTHAPVVLLGLPPGSRHDLGLLSFCLLLRDVGLDPIYLGADVPVDNWIAAVERDRPLAAVTVAVTADDVPLAGDVVRLVTAQGVPVYVGGGAQGLVDGPGLGHRLAPAAARLAGILAAPQAGPPHVGVADGTL